VEAIKQHIDAIAGYKEIILCFDMDEPGRNATEDVLKMLPPGKGKTVLLPEKDAFDVIKKDNGAGQLRYAISKAKAFVPKTLVTGSELVKASLERTRKSQKSGIKTGYPSLDKLSGGFKPGEVITIVAGTGTGKTSFTLNLTYNISVDGDSKVLFIPLEMGLDNIVNRMYELHTGNRVYTPEGIVIHDDFEEVAEVVCENLVVFDHIGSLDTEKLTNDVQFAVSAYGVNCLVLDHKDAMVSNLDSGDNGYKAIDSMMGSLKKLAIDSELCIILVSHQSRSTDDKNDTKASLNRVRGSQGVAQNSDMVLGLERERDSNITTVKTLKAHRLIGVFGEFALGYDPKTKKMRELTLDNAEYKKDKNNEEKILREDNQMERNHVQKPTRSNSSPELPPTNL
jgi:twinkle protein